MKKTLLFFIVLQFLAQQMIAQVTTYFYGKDKIDSKDWTAGLYSVETNAGGITYVTIELIPKRNLKRMTYWTSRNTVIVIKDRIMELPIDGFAEKLENGLIGVRSQPFEGGWGWNNVKKGEKYYYTLAFDGGIPPGITNFTMIDRGNSFGEHGYQFWNYQLNNPHKGATSFTEYSIKDNILFNNDGVCGIYESIDEYGYKIGCIIQDGIYKLIYINGNEGLEWWRLGDIKAILQPSATSGLYKATWYTRMKGRRDNVVVTFDGTGMSVAIDDEITNFIKMFPTSNQVASAKEWSGTGFALTNNYIVTNFHVIENAKNIQVQGVNGNFDSKYNAMVIATDKDNDLAILKLNKCTISSQRIPYSIKTATSEVGEEVFVLGYPLTSTMGDEIKLTTGVISSRTGFQGDVSQYQISAPIQPGNSGGPLFDSKGNIIGIVSAKHKGAENVGYAIKVSYLRNLIECSVSSDILPQNNKISYMKLTEKVKSIKNYVYYITCSSEDGYGTSNYNSAYGGDVSQTYSKTYNNPATINNMAYNLSLNSVTVQDNQTILTFSVNNRTRDGYFEWMNLDKNTYIMANDQKFFLKRTEGIAISPDMTDFSYVGETITFKLYFPAIPKNTTTIDFVESLDSDWKIYGIQLYNK